MTEIRVTLPFHLQRLAGVTGEVTVRVRGEPTIGQTLEELERAYPELLGTVREPGSPGRRAYLRIFAGGLDLSLESPDAPLPDGVVRGRDTLDIIGAIAGG